jgi:hypothetical protein
LEKRFMPRKIKNYLDQVARWCALSGNTSSFTVPTVEGKGTTTVANSTNAMLAPIEFTTTSKDTWQEEDSNEDQ